MRPPTAPEAHPFCRGGPLGLRGEPSPLECRTEAAVALESLPKVAYLTALDHPGAHADQGGGRGQVHAGPCGGRLGAEASRRRTRGSAPRARTDLRGTSERSMDGFKGLRGGGTPVYLSICSCALFVPIIQLKKNPTHHFTFTPPVHPSTFLSKICPTISTFPLQFVERMQRRAAWW
jgi:hypothetical protein